MQNKYLLITWLVLPIVVLIGWIINIEINLHTENTVTIRMRGYDPIDLLSGHYLYLQPDWSETDCRQFEQNICPSERFAYSYRYYLPEFDAVNIDRLIAHKNPKIDMVFTYQGQSNPLVKGLRIDGKDWQDWLTSQSADQPQPANNAN